LYVRERNEIIGELAVVYKDRIFGFALKNDGTALCWNDLVQREGDNECAAKLLEDVQRSHPEIHAQLVTHVDYFLECHQVPQFARSPDTVDFVVELLEKARSFQFRDRDQHYAELSKRLCDVIQENYNNDNVPSTSTLAKVMGPVRG